MKENRLLNLIKQICEAQENEKIVNTLVIIMELMLDTKTNIKLVDAIEYLSSHNIQDLHNNWKIKLDDLYQEEQGRLEELTKNNEMLFGDNEAKLQGLHNNWEGELDGLKNTYESNFKELTDKISNLLPGAASAGLASAYREQKTNLAKERKGWMKISFASVLLFIGIVIYIHFEGRTNGNDFGYVELLRSVLRSVPIWIVGSFLIYYSTRQVTRLVRMESEYAHKERLNATYEGYSRAVESLEGERGGELKVKLTDIMLESARFNPSATLEKSDK